MAAPPGARSGSTTVWSTTSSHGSRASGSPRQNASSWSAMPGDAAVAGGDRPGAAEVEVGLERGVHGEHAQPRPPGVPWPRSRSARSGRPASRPAGPGARRRRPRAGRRSADRPQWSPRPPGRPLTPIAATGAAVTHRCRRAPPAAAPAPPAARRSRRSAWPSRTAAGPAAIDAGSTPVPGRRGSWIVASDSHSTNERTTGCSNRAWITSQALPARSGQVRRRRSARAAARSSTGRARPRARRSTPSISVGERAGVRGRTSGPARPRSRPGRGA